MKPIRKPLRKPKAKRDVPPLCAAVRRLRAQLDLSQEEMAAKLSLATMTLSRYERGANVPKDADVLSRLRVAATNAGLEQEAKLFAAAIEVRPAMPRDAYMLAFSPSMWRLMQAARIAAVFFPETARAMEQAAGPALAVVDEVIASAMPPPGAFDAHFYLALERGLDAVAEERAFRALQERTK